MKHLVTKYQRLNTHKKFSVFLLGYWLFLILFAFIDSKGKFGSDIGVKKTLKTSSFARIMFQDIGALSTLAAIWTVTQTKNPIRWVVAFLSVFTGSFALLPFLSWHFWRKK
jgi:hypothetical protein